MTLNTSLGTTPATGSDRAAGSTPAGSGASSAPRPAGRRPAKRLADWRQRAEIAVLAGPAVIVFVTFVILPVAMAAYYGFFKWQGYGPPTDFVGLQNYLIIFQDQAFRSVLMHNGFIVVLSLVLQGPIAIVLALLLNQKMHGRGLVRVLVFVPYVISEVIVGTGWSLLLQSNGAVNDMLQSMGLGGLRADWLSNPDIAIWTLLVIISWKYIGFAVILFLAGLQSIPEEPSRPPRSTAPATGRSSGASRCRCSARRSASGRSCRSSARSSCSTSSTSSGGSTSPPPRAPRRWRPTWSATGGTPGTTASAVRSLW